MNTVTWEMFYIQCDPQNILYSTYFKSKLSEVQGTVKAIGRTRMTCSRIGILPWNFLSMSLGMTGLLGRKRTTAMLSHGFQDS